MRASPDRRLASARAPDATGAAAGQAGRHGEAAEAVAGGRGRVRGALPEAGGARGRVGAPAGAGGRGARRARAGPALAGARAAAAGPSGPAAAAGGEDAPSGEKVFSVFEPHTRWVSKGKAGNPVELGVPVCVVEDPYRFVLDWSVLWEGEDVHVAVPLIEAVRATYPDLRACSFDKGFHSPANRTRLDTGRRRLCSDGRVVDRGRQPAHARHTVAAARAARAPARAQRPQEREAATTTGRVSAAVSSTTTPPTPSFGREADTSLQGPDRAVLRPRKRLRNPVRSTQLPLPDPRLSRHQSVYVASSPAKPPFSGRH